MPTNEPKQRKICSSERGGGSDRHLGPKYTMVIARVKMVPEKTLKQPSTHVVLPAFLSHFIT
jgi:hypothetical protein